MEKRNGKDFAKGNTLHEREQPPAEALTVIPTTTWRKGCGVTWGRGVSLTAERSPFGLHMGIQNGSV